MDGKILQLARKDAQRHITSGGFQTDITLSTPTGSNEVVVSGWGTLHHLSYDSDGNLIDSKNAHINIAESELIRLGFPYRNEIGEISLRNCRVSYKDSQGVIGRYVVLQNHPSQTFGCIVAILGDFENGGLI